jgi:hypothetical protein
MSLYYPQGGVILRPRWEDFGSGSAILQEVKDIPVSCRSLSVERNDYSEADTFKATIDYAAFPFDPRCMRACAVTICMEDRKKTYNLDNSLNLIEPTPDNTVFIGFADESSIKFDDTTRTVQLEGRDYTSLFIDQKRVNTEPIALSKPIDQIIQDLINEQLATKDIKVDNRTGENPMPTLAQLAPDFNPVTSVKNQKRKETYWEIMQDIVSRVGFVGFIELDKYVITKPQNIYEKKNIKHFIYGGNIKDLNFTRKLGRAKDFNVLVKSFNPLEKRIEEAKLPEEAKDAQFIANFGNVRTTVPQLDKDGKKIDPPKDADFYTFLVKDITNKEQLIKIGESIFEELSRQQIEGSLTTYEMEVPEERNEDTSPIKFSQMRNGSAIRIFLSQAELKEIDSNANKAQRKAFLLRRGYPRELADAWADSLSRINTVFYVKSVMFEMDMDNGFTMKIDFINFIDLDSSLLGE